MLTKPDLTDDRLIARLGESYGISARTLEFLPRGADFAAWAYRVEADDGRTYFLKLRKGRADAVGLLVPREPLVPAWSRGVRQLQALIEQRGQHDRHVRELAAIWQDRRDQITRIVERAEALGRRLRTRHGAFVVCHTDIHLNNVLVDLAGHLHVVDWDAPRQAPIERDLHFVVGSVIGRIPIGPPEEALIFQGYGPTNLDWDALLYYRFDWVSGDLLAYGKQVCLIEEASEASKEQAIERTRRIFEAGRALDSAYALERRRLETPR